MNKKQTPTRFAVEAAGYNLSLAGLILGSMRWNPAIWANDFPPDIKEAVGPPDPQAKRQKVLIAVPFFLIAVGFPIWSTLRLKRRHGGKLSFPAAFANIFGFIASFWLLDLTILDWLIFVTITPDFVVIPGTEGWAGYDDYAFHLREHMRAFPFLVVASLILALIPWLIPVPKGEI